MRRFFAAALTLLLGSTPLLCVENAAAQGTTDVKSAGAAAEEAPSLLTYAFVAAPTADSAVVSLINGEKPIKGELRYRPQGTEPWMSVPVELAPTTQDKLRGGVQNVRLDGLKPGTRYEYELREGDQAVPGGSGSFMTQRVTADPFRFIAMTDAHVNPANPERSPVLRVSADTAMRYRPDFVFHLGDNIQTVGSTHGGPAAEENHPNIFYIYYRQMLGQLQSQAGQFILNGNWEGENGWHPEPTRSWARNARMTFAPAPNSATYPEGGSKNEDYYAFTWGDALFIGLNATGYNAVNHEHTRGPGSGSDWTLGKDQFEWLEKTLAESKAKWKFLFIHHAVGGNAGDDVNTRYGRGGGRAAHIGEQAKVHELMRKYGVEAFFYAHDHVFTDMDVDGIHYICTGSVGAPWKFTTAETGYENYIPDSGFTVVDIDGDKATVRYVRPDNNNPLGKELYSVTLKPANTK